MTPEERLAAAFVADHPADAVRLLERADPADAAALLAGLPVGEAAEVYRVLGPSPAAACALALGDEALAAIVAELPLDAAGGAVRCLDATRRKKVLDLLGEERREQLRTLLAYPAHTAGAVADPLVVALPVDMTVADAQRQLKGNGGHLIAYLYVVSRERVLEGALAVRELLAARPREILASVMRPEPVRVLASADLATVAVHPAWRDYDALPVTDSGGRLIGAIRHKTIRHLSASQDRSMTSLLIGLSEVYWAGLSGMLATLAGPRPVGPARVEENRDVP